MTLALAFALPAFAQPAPGDVPHPTPVAAPAEVPSTPASPSIPAAPEAPEMPAIPAVPAVPSPPKMVLDQQVEIGSVANDLFLMAQDARTTGAIDDNAFIMAQMYEQEGPIHGDLFVMAEHIRLDGPIEGDVYALADRVEITSNAQILGGVQVGAASLELFGPVAGDVNAQVGRLVIGAPVAGDLTVNVEELEVRDGTAIAGDLTYATYTPNPALEGAAAGEIEHSMLEVDLGEEEPEEESSLVGSLLWWTGMRGWGFLTKLLVGGVLLLIGGERIAAIGRRAVTHPGESLGLGFVVAAALPFASLIALATVVPFPLGLLGFAAWFIALYVAQIFAAQAVGDTLLRRFQPDALGNPYLSLAIGLVPLVILFGVPWLGTLAWIAATLIGMGAMWSIIRGHA